MYQELNWYHYSTFIDPLTSSLYLSQEPLLFLVKFTSNHGHGVH